MLPRTVEAKHRCLSFLRGRRLLTLFLLITMFLTAAAAPPPRMGAAQTEPPDHVVKLIFIHHSTGENWLRDDYGGLGMALAQNNYYVSDTNYGWGPDGIGDRTDIPNWTEWFASEATQHRYMAALFTESGQNSSYTRPLSAPDPREENTVITFKSCFPNSALEGNPDDPPDPEGWLTVGHAKYVYNQILPYFGSRPDKLFIVITAPPLSDPTYAANARAFNQWLVHDWLEENNYSLNNVAVFDFYNILTGPDAHYRYSNGGIEEIPGGSDILYYPSEDDHPSIEGSLKATEEFVPLLNYFYQRWLESGPVEPLEPQVPEQPAETQASEGLTSEPVQPAERPDSGALDDFESGQPVGTSGWAPNWDGESLTLISCLPSNEMAHGGLSSLKISFDVPAGTWSNCALDFEAPQDLGSAKGLQFYLHASQAGIPYSVVVFSATGDNRETYTSHQESPSDSINDWAKVEVAWSDLLRVDWEEDAGTPFYINKPVTGLAFGLDGTSDASNSGTFWVDDLGLLGSQTPSDAGQDQTEQGERGSPGLPCPGSAGLGLILGGLAWFSKKTRAR